MKLPVLLLGLLGLLGASSHLESTEVIFAVRPPKGPHWYENFGTTIHGKPAYAIGGRLCRLDLATGKLTTLLQDADGSVRDPQVHYDGGKILFSYRRGGTEFYQLHEINVDGSELRQLTSDPFDDLEPAYLPDGGIVFCSSRARRFVPCWYVPVATLHRCDGQGRNIQPLSSNIEQDNTPWVLPDGRVLYTRWEYVDRSREHFHHLWVMNPDGTAQMPFYGNMHPGDVFLDAKPIPGSSTVVMINSPNHGRQEHEGRVSIVRVDEGPDLRPAQRMINEKNNFRDPYPLAEGEILVAQENKLLLMDEEGQTRELFRLAGDLAAGGAWIHEPRALRARAREPVIPARSDLRSDSGQLVVMDIYQGRNMQGVQRGTIKKLLVLENLPKPVNYTGSMDPISYGGSYTLNRVLGTAPVEADGSVNVTVPPLRSLQLVALDAQDLSVKRMLSFMTVMPGERATCFGCHEERNVSLPAGDVPLALRRAPSEIEPVADTPEVFDYPRDIQPILDKHCVRCHDTREYAGGVLLTGDQGPMFTHSYFTLSARLQLADGRDLARGNYAPYTIGSSASYLLEKLAGKHHDVKVAEAELRRVKLWIDAAATFPGTYAALGSGMLGPYAALEYGTKPKIDFLSWPGLKRAKEAMDRRCHSCHTGTTALPAHPADHLGVRLHHLAYSGGKPRFWEPPWLRAQAEGSPRPGTREWMEQNADPHLRFSNHILYNLSRPELSLQLLAPLSKAAGGHAACGDVFRTTEDADYRMLLAGIEEAKAHLEKITRFNMAGFRPEPEYVREMQHYGILSPGHSPSEAIDVYETDRMYWRSLWHQPR